uniref:protein-tyrosine-phosphatase n=1 Tax=Cyanoderma ruficeps TaxID=181631 RepID=A0A8C3QKT0_9PASS
MQSPTLAMSPLNWAGWGDSLSGFPQSSLCPFLCQSPHRGTVLNVSVSDHDRSDSLLVSWDEPEGGAKGYLLGLSSLGSGTLLQNVSAGANTTSFWFHGLTPGTCYEIEVTATLACTDTTSQTITAQTRPSPVHNLSLSSGGSCVSLRAAWAHGHGGRDGYGLALWHSHSQTLVRNVSLLPGATTFLFDGLLAGSEYALKVTTLAGSSQASTSTHQWTAPSSPTQLRLSPGSSTSLVASWANATAAAWIHLELRNLLTQKVSTTLSARRGLTSYTFQHLHPGTQYWLGLSAMAGPHTVVGPNATWTCESEIFPVFCRDGTSWHCGSSTTSWTSILCFPPDPLSLANVSVQPGQKPQELHVSWVESGGGRDHLVQLSVAESLSIIRNVSVPRGVSQLDLEGLVPGSRYRVEIISQAGPHRISSQTAIGYTVPLPPRSLSASPSSMARALAVHWEASPGQRDGYLLSVLEEGSSSLPRKLEAGKDSTNVTVPQLEPGTCYLVRIWAVAGPYRSLPENITGCTVPAAPTNLSLTNPGSSSELYTSWNKPPGRRDHYHVTLYSLSTQSRIQVQTLSPDALNITWTQLEAGSKFAVQVTAVKGSLEASSINVTEWTYPLAPRNVYMTNQGYPNRLSASWRAEPQGQDSYRLLLYHSGSGAVAANVSVGKGTSKFTFSGLAPGHKYLLEVVSVAGPYAASAGNISDWTSKCQSWGFCILHQAQPSHLGGLSTCSGKGQRLSQDFQHLLQGLIPGRNYSVSLSCVAGPYWSSTKPLAVPVEPSPVKDVQCLPESRSLYLNWTSSPGDVESYEVVTERLSEGPPTSRHTMSIPSSEASLEGLEPNSSYQIVVSTVGMNTLRSQAVTLLCSTAVERESPSFPQPCHRSRGLLESRKLLRPTQEIMSSTWYDHYYGTEDSYLAVLLPNPFHQRSSPETWRVPVGTEECGQSRATCNGKLKDNEQYSADTAPLSMPIITIPVCIQVCCRSHGWAVSLTGWPGLPVTKTSFPLDLISCRNVHRPVPLQNFKQYYEMKTANANHAFFQEFEELKEVGKEQSKVEAELPANVSKNRYAHVLPYDHTRVKLSQLGEDPHSDYINANFMPGYTSQQEFIATQGPLKKTIEDFWRLVWEQNVCNIIMLTVCMENGRVLCDHYWPSESAPVSYGQVQVHLLMQSSSEEWTIREFKLWHGLQAERFVSHLHYTAWPDHGIPESTTSIMTFRELVQEHIQSTKDAGPTLVHCSAGVGRTGTFIALDRLLQQMKQEKVVDIFGVVYALRMNRYQMIQTLVRSLLPPSPGPSLHSIGVHRSFAQHYAQKAAKSHMGFLREYEVRAALGRCRECCHGCIGDMSQMGTLISLDCLLYQMKAERTVDIFGVTLQLARSCCLMTPTLVEFFHLLGSELRSVELHVSSQ